MEGTSTQPNGATVKVSVSEATPETAKVKSKKPRLRVVGHVADAIKRFKASLNPTVDFRKHNLPEDALPAKSVQETKKELVEHPKLLKRVYTHNTSGRLVPRKTRPTSGNKTYYLTRAMFPVKPKS